MNDEKIFVGRRDEIEQFKKALERPRGEAVVVVGQAGMGKTFLVNKMAEIAETYPGLKCGWVRYEVTPTDSVDSTMALMMDNAFEAANTKPGSFDNVPERKRQWLALLKLAKLVPAGKWIGKALGEKTERLVELLKSLRRDPAKDTRQQFLERLGLISKRLPKNGRAVFIVDPEKYMQKESDQSWAIVVRDLPKKVKLVFAQRPEDVLVESETFGGLGNVVRIPERRLDVLSEAEVEELVNCRRENLRVEISDLREVLNRYKGHPYAIGAALDLVEAGTELEELPKKGEPIRFAELQWKRVCDDGGDGAIELFEAYAILEVGVPDDVAEAVSSLKPAKRKAVLAGKFLAGLLREEGYGRRIYHTILADYILGQIGEKEKEEYRGRAVSVYREKLRKAKKEQIKPDALAAERLAEHVLAAEGEDAFVYAFGNECYPALNRLGLLDTAIGLSEQALSVVRKDSQEEMAVLGNLGVIYQMKGKLNKAEQMHIRSLEIAERLGLLEGMANQYGNLGVIYQMRGELDKAVQMIKNSLEINERLGQNLGMAKSYGNLGLIYLTTRDLDSAERMVKNSLEINERFRFWEGLAGDYGNLGMIYGMRNNLEKAEQLHKKALEVNEKLGRLEGIANQCGNLGVVYQKRCELDRSEQMHKKSLEIHEQLGLQEGMANDHGNLGVIYKQRGDVKKAREYWEKARELYKRIGMPREVKEVEGWIEGI